jgi:hypothetical protein
MQNFSLKVTLSQFRPKNTKVTFNKPIVHLSDLALLEMVAYWGQNAKV